MSIHQFYRDHSNVRLGIVHLTVHSSHSINQLLCTHNWRIVVITFNPGKTLRHLMLISAGIVLHANGTLAGEFVGDAQMHARDLLSGTVRGRAKVVDVSPAIPTDTRHAFNLDPQEQARQLILGKPNFATVVGRAVGLSSKRTAMPEVSVRELRRADTDAQESARRMILGGRV
jgi:hypothetical protein